MTDKTYTAKQVEAAERLAQFMYSQEARKCTSLGDAEYYRSNWRRGLPEAHAMLDAAFPATLRQPSSQSGAAREDSRAYPNRYWVEVINATYGGKTGEAIKGRVSTLIYQKHGVAGELMSNSELAALARPASSDRAAYEGAREDLLDWKGRALRSESRLRALGYRGIDASEAPAASEPRYSHSADGKRVTLLNPEDARYWERPASSEPASGLCQRNHAANAAAPMTVASPTIKLMIGNDPASGEAVAWQFRSRQMQNYWSGWMLYGYAERPKNIGQFEFEYRPLYTHPAEPVKVADGYVLVPREPTEAMLEAGNLASAEADERASREANLGKAGMLYRKNRVAHVYAAMLAAAPGADGENDRG
jgi:hypothetical protein